MKAVVFTKYGPPDVLSYEEVEKPVPGDNDVLVKVHAACINDWDWGNLRGKPFINRMIFGLFRPKRSNILGCDMAGRVEKVGANVKKFKEGDEVFGDLSNSGFATFAEYVSAPENALVPKSPSMTFKQAAALPQAGALAVQGLRDKGQVKKGQRVLINGAGGGVGTLGVQIAKLAGAEVTCVDAKEKLDLLTSLGADHVIDYKKVDYTKTGKQYDLILDNVVTRSMFSYKRTLRPGGRLLMIGGDIPRIIRIALTAPLISGRKKLGILGLRPNVGLDYLNELFEAGKLKIMIDRTYKLKEVPEAFRFFGTAKHKGKIVITVVPDKKS
ncbi:MAG: NAD(P)-dependent alcohol dehydrogenase [Thermoplasmata archaeon]|nr:MAG: NAD(P)-dependent alcohol dehydrogenase [Thermoplasmata archaeon]